MILQSHITLYNTKTKGNALDAPHIGVAAFVLKARRGFTLIEMLITVAIIAILVGIAIPSLQQSKENSNLAAALAVADQLNAAATRLRNDSIANAGTFGNDKTAALAVYMAAQFFNLPPSLNHVTFVNGVWVADTVF